MHAPHRRFASVALCSSLAALGCGGSGGGDLPDADIVSYNCAAETRAQTYTVGLEEMGRKGLIDMRLMNADPAPPARGDNTWLVQLATLGSDGPAASVVGATLKVSPYMPDHMHGTPITVEVTDQGSGMYQLTPVNLWMPGYWETTISVTLPASVDSGANDSVVYKFCLAE